MLAAAGQAFEEVFTPPFRAVLWKCVGFTIALLAALIVAVEWSFSHFVSWPDWIETTIQWLGGLALVAASIFLISPVTSLIAGLYLDDIAAKVERTNFPSDPPGRELPAVQAAWLAVKFFLVVLVVNLVALFLLLIPGVNLVAFYLGNGYLLGREYFELAAMRHLSQADAKRLRKANRLTVLLCGLVIALLASVPILNLVTPLFATGFMVRMYKRLAAKAGVGLAPRLAT
ncbi:MAG: sulfate transporter family protein [Hyphomicrobiales bacterium]